MTLPQFNPNIKDFLETTYNKYHSKSFLSKDPLILAHDCRREPYFIPVALSAALFAYGRVDQILKNGRRLQESIHDFYYTGKLNINYLYRLQTSQDIQIFIKSSFKLLEFENQLKSLMNTIDDPIILIDYIRNILLSEIRETQPQLSNGLKFLLGTDDLFSAKKRFMMFLRWMVREDEFDFGIWKIFPKNKLIYPLDTHISRIGKEMFPFIPNQNNLSKALAITQSLSAYCPEDPVKFDFSLCHSGMEDRNSNIENF